MGRNAAETVLGGVVLLVAGVFLFVAFNLAQVKTVSGYEVTANFLDIGGLSKGSDVRINGIKVGTVVDRVLDEETFEAQLKLSISKDVKLPKETEAFITSEGVLGGKYLRLVPSRKSGEFIEAGGKIVKTNDFKSLEDQVGEIIFLATGGE